MNRSRFFLSDEQIKVSCTSFTPKNNGSEEYFFTLEPCVYRSFAEQLKALEQAYETALEKYGLSSESAVLRRFFLSDPANQRVLLGSSPLATSSVKSPCAISVVGQAPLPNSKVALFAHHVKTATGCFSGDAGACVFANNGYRHCYFTELARPEEESSEAQTWKVFADIDQRLEKEGLDLKRDSVRTWIYVQNVDANYFGLVKARREHFTAHGMTADTHYIASTGIEGTHCDPRTKVLFDYYAVGGLDCGQIQFVEARSHLNPTHEYGVTFERATAVDYGDRRQIFVSGTASIDNQGQVVHPGDVANQFERAVENVEALLHNAAAKLSDLTHLIVYLRDLSDHDLLRERLDERFPDLPKIITVAPVCRPGWLVELECRAIVGADNPAYRPF